MPLASRFLSPGLRLVILVSALLALPLTATALPAFMTEAPCAHLNPHRISQKKKTPDYKAIWAKLMALVKANKITMEQAKKKMAAIKKAHGKTGWKKKKLTKKDLAAIAKKLKALVAAKKITEAEAKAKWAAILEKIKAKKNK